MRRCSLTVVALAGCLGLSGCNGVPISTLWKLRNFRFATADVAKIRAAIKTPKWLTPTPEKAVGEAHRAAREGEPEAPEIPIRLRRAVVAGDDEALAKLSPDAANAVIVEVAPPDLPALRALQEEARARAPDGARVAAGKSGGLSFKHNLACRKTDIPESGPIPVSVWFHPDDELGWLPLYDRFDARPLLEQAQKEDPSALADALPPCDSHKAKQNAGKTR